MPKFINYVTLIIRVEFLKCCQVTVLTSPVTEIFCIFINFLYNFYSHRLYITCLLRGISVAQWFPPTAPGNTYARAPRKKSTKLSTSFAKRIGLFYNMNGFLFNFTNMY